MTGQYPEMAAGLYRRFALFRSELDACCRAPEPHLGPYLRTILHSDSAEDTKSRALELAQAKLGEPALFAVAYAH